MSFLRAAIVTFTLTPSFVYGNCGVNDIVTQQYFPLDLSQDVIGVRNHNVALAEKFHLTTNLTLLREGGVTFFDQRISNGYEHRGFTTCTCAELTVGGESKYVIGELGGSWGTRAGVQCDGSCIRHTEISGQIDPNRARYIDGVVISSGWCPREFDLDSLMKDIGDLSEGARAIIGE